MFQHEFVAVTPLICLIKCDLCFEVDVYHLATLFFPLQILYCECGLCIQDTQLTTYYQGQKQSTAICMVILAF